MPRIKKSWDEPLKIGDVMTKDNTGRYPIVEIGSSGTTFMFLFDGEYRWTTIADCKKWLYTLEGEEEKVCSMKEKHCCIKNGDYFIHHCNYSFPEGICKKCGSSCKGKEEAWEPKVEEEYWYITSAFGVERASWVNDSIDKGRRDGLGIFPSKALAEAAFERAKKAAKQQ